MCICLFQVQKFTSLTSLLPFYPKFLTLKKNAYLFSDPLFHNSFSFKDLCQHMPTIPQKALLCWLYSSLGFFFQYHAFFFLHLFMLNCFSFGFREWFFSSRRCTLWLLVRVKTFFFPSLLNTCWPSLEFLGNNLFLKKFFFFFFFFWSFCFFLGLLPWHMEIPRLGG